MPENTLTPAQKFLEEHTETLYYCDNGEATLGVEAITKDNLEEYIRLLKEEWKETLGPVKRRLSTCERFDMPVTPPQARGMLKIFSEL